VQIVLATVALAITLGTALGLLGRVSARLDGWLLMTVTDTVLAFPGMLLALGLIRSWDRATAASFLPLRLPTRRRSYGWSAVLFCRSANANSSRRRVRLGQCARNYGAARSSQHIAADRGARNQPVRLGAVSESALSFLAWVSRPPPDMGKHVVVVATLHGRCGLVEHRSRSVHRGHPARVNLLGDALRDWLDLGDSHE